MKKMTKYLYGISPHQFKDLPYEQALKFKMGAARGLMKQIAETKDNEERYIAAEKAMRFNKRLLEELLTNG